MRQKAPQKFIPTHLFQVLHVGVGKASGSVPYNLETIYNCMIRWGEIKNISDKFINIDLNSLKKVKNKFILTIKNENISVDKNIVKNLVVGDFVTVHWKKLVKKLLPKKRKNSAIGPQQCFLSWFNEQ